jgi:hypothetical protein
LKEGGVEVLMKSNNEAKCQSQLLEKDITFGKLISLKESERLNGYLTSYNFTYSFLEHNISLPKNNWSNSLGINFTQMLFKSKQIVPHMKHTTSLIQ